MEKLRTGALYIRVSTDKQEELSPDAQRRLLLEYAAKNNIILSNEYIFEEDGISGRKADKRPNFQRMIGLAKSKEHPFDVILVWKFSRFARNQEESIVYKSLLRKNNVEVISVSNLLLMVLLVLSLKGSLNGWTNTTLSGYLAKCIEV